MARARTRLLLQLVFVFAAHLLASCAPSVSEAPAQARVVLKLGSQAYRSTTATSLPRGLCYLINVTGDRLTRQAPATSGCGPSAGLGLNSPRAYSVGEVAELSVLIGVQRRFDLIGVKAPRGLDASGTALCGSLNVQIGGAAEPSNLVIQIEGQTVNSPAIQFYSGTSDIKAGDNEVTLNPVSYVASSLTLTYGLGAPYDRQNLPGSAMAGKCGDGLGSANTDLVGATSASLAQAITDTSSGIALQSVTSTPLIMNAPVPASEGSFQLKTGLEEIIYGE